MTAQAPARHANPADRGQQADRAAPASPWGLGHLPALDGLRGAAVAAVLLYHGGYLKGGYLGVDLFFVLSGFLITSLLLSEHRGTGRVNLLEFWRRRARRLLPALFLLLAGVALYATVWARPIDLGGIRSSGLGAVFYVANWQQILHGTNYWDISLSPSPLQHVWSLAIEEQFYLVWPLVILGLLRGGGRHRGRHVQNICLGLSVVSTGLFIGLHAAGVSDNRVYEGTDTRATALLLGAALAGWRAEHGPVEDQERWPLVETIGTAAALLLGAAWLFLSGTSSLVYEGGLPVCSVLAVLVVAAATNRKSPTLGWIFRFKPLRQLGAISYGLYLWHWPIYQVLNPGRTGLTGLALLAVRIAVSLVVAMASYTFLEQPIRHGALRQKVPKILAPIGAVAAVLLLLLSTTGAVSPAAVNQVAAPTQAIAQIPGAPTVMVVGDSVGNSVAGPMIDDPWTYGINPVNEAVIGCELMFKGHQVRDSHGTVTSRPDCTTGYRAEVQQFKPAVVVVFFGGASGAGSVQIGGSFTTACSPAYAQEQERLHTQMIDDLRSAGAKVALVTLARSDDVAFFPPPWNENIACYNDTLRAVAKTTGSQLIDLDAWLCPGGTCRKNIDGAPARPDGLHFNGPGGRAAAAFLVQEALAGAGLKASPTARKVPPACADLRHATSPVLGLIGKTSDDARRSSLDRLKYVDLAAVAHAAPDVRSRQDLTVLSGDEAAMKQVLSSTPDGTTLTLSSFSPEVARALGDLKTYLQATCTGE